MGVKAGGPGRAFHVALIHVELHFPFGQGTDIAPVFLAVRDEHHLDRTVGAFGTFGRRAGAGPRGPEKFAEPNLVFRQEVLLVTDHQHQAALERRAESVDGGGVLGLPQIDPRRRHAQGAPNGRDLHG